MWYRSGCVLSTHLILLGCYSSSCAGQQGQYGPGQPLALCKSHSSLISQQRLNAASSNIVAACLAQDLMTCSQVREGLRVIMPCAKDSVRGSC
jgi:hypothetical protein